MADPIKEAFLKVKQDVVLLTEQLYFLSSQIEELKNFVHEQSTLITSSSLQPTIQQTDNQTDRQTNRLGEEDLSPILPLESYIPLPKNDRNTSNTLNLPISMEESTIMSKNQTDNQTDNPTDTLEIQPNSSFSQTIRQTDFQKLPLQALKTSFFDSSIGNRGVPTDRQTDPQTNQQTGLNELIATKNLENPLSSALQPIPPSPLDQTQKFVLINKNDPPPRTYTLSLPHLQRIPISPLDKPKTSRPSTNILQDSEVNQSSPSLVSPATNAQTTTTSSAEPNPSPNTSLSTTKSTTNPLFVEPNPQNTSPVSASFHPLSTQTKLSSDPIQQIARAAAILDSLDDIKKDLRLKVKRLTHQEMLIFSSVYQLEEHGFTVDYPLLASRLSLSESSIRDYILKILKKGIPLVKSKENNKRVTLSVHPDLKRIANLSTILALREI